MYAELYDGHTGKKIATVKNVNGRAVCDNQKISRVYLPDDLYVAGEGGKQVKPSDGDKYIEALPFVFRGGQAVSAKVFS